MRHRPCSAARPRRLAESARRRRSARPRNSAETCLETALRASANLISGWGPSHRLAASFSSLPWLWEAKHRSLLARAARLGLERGAEPRCREGAKALHLGLRQAILATEQAHRESLRLEVLEDEAERPLCDAGLGLIGQHPRNPEPGARGVDRGVSRVDDKP